MGLPENEVIGGWSPVNTKLLHTIYLVLVYSALSTISSNRHPSSDILPLLVVRMRMPSVGGLCVSYPRYKLAAGDQTPLTASPLLSTSGPHTGRRPG